MPVCVAVDTPEAAVATVGGQMDGEVTAMNSVFPAEREARLTAVRGAGASL